MTPRMLPLALASVVIFALACLFPIMTVSLHGIHNEVTLWQTAWALSAGEYFPLLAFGAAFLLIIAPFLQITLIAWLLLFARYRRCAPGFIVIIRMLLWLRPWSMVEVGVLGFLVAAVKLTTLLDVSIGPGGWALAVSVALMLIVTRQDFRPLWTLVPIRAAGNHPHE